MLAQLRGDDVANIYGQRWQPAGRQLFASDLE
jgi:hypothetical protein